MAHIHVLCITTLHTEANRDFAPFNNMTVGEASRAVLTHIAPSHCFSITILARPDNELDDRSFSLRVVVRDMAKIDPSIERIGVPDSGFVITVQPCKLCCYIPYGLLRCIMCHVT